MLAEWKTYGIDRGTWLATQVRSAADGSKMQILQDLHYRGEGERGVILLEVPGEAPALHLVQKTDQARKYRNNAAFSVYPEAGIVVQNDPLLLDLDRRIFLGPVDQEKARAFGDLVFQAVQCDSLLKFFG